MRDDELSASYQPTSPVDFRAAVDLLGSDHLIADSRQMFVIFRNTVLDIEVEKGDLETAELVAIEALDTPRSAEAETILMERFLEHLKTTTGTDWVEAADHT